MNKTDLAGKVFGRLTVVSDAGRTKDRHVRWLCLCECGNSTITIRISEADGARSCGCLRVEQSAHVGKEWGPRNVRHGHTLGRKQSPTYLSFRAMIGRCQNPKHPGYETYGKAGVQICDRWKTFDNFLTDLGERPEGKTLGRILDRGNYEPGNVVWMTKAEQNLTRKNNHALAKWESTQ